MTGITKENKIKGYNHLTQRIEERGAVQAKDKLNADN
jgi:hypothetical protein